MLRFHPGGINNAGSEMSLFNTDARGYPWLEFQLQVVYRMTEGVGAGIGSGGVSGVGYGKWGYGMNTERGIGFVGVSLYCGVLIFGRMKFLPIGLSA